MNLGLWRAHGLGNDYLVVEDGTALTPALAAALCDRHRGVGSDGVLEPTHTDLADHGVRIWNPDGSIAEKSGNGLRIFATWLVERRGAPASFTVDTGFDRVACTVAGSGVAVQMGRMTGLRSLRLLDLDVWALSVGNPHCVVFRDEDLDTLPWRTWGRQLEIHPVFPRRTNVQIARVAGPDRVEVRVWERGAGETLASGSSACAVAAAAVATDRLARGRITVAMPGGSLHVTVHANHQLLLEGPVEVVGTVGVDPRWLAARRGATGKP